jgi:hypothetical protein
MTIKKMPDSLLLKFQKLPDALKARASDPQAMRALDLLEKDFSLNLAELVMRVLVGEVSPEKLDEALNLSYGAPKEKAKTVAQAMLDRLFFPHHLLEVPEVPQEKPFAAPPLKPQAGAEPYLVHPDDQKDLVKHTQNLQTAPPPAIDTNFESVVARLIKAENLQLDPIGRRRFEKIVESRLVEVRDKLETRDSLMRSSKIGGMGFDEIRAGRIGLELERIVEELHRRPRPTPQPKPAPVPIIPKPVAPKVAPVAPPPPKTVLPPPPVKAPISSQPVATQILPKPQTSPAPPSPAKVAPPPWFRPSGVPPARPAPIKPPPVPVKPKVREPQVSYQEMVTDVRAPAKVMGPTEVLASLDLPDFRRLGESPKERVEKIRDEIEALGRDSFALKTSGIQAWRNSPTFKNYLEIGQQAMEKKQDLIDVIQLLKAQGKPALDQEEFEAIGWLMRQFRF